MAGRKHSNHRIWVAVAMFEAGAGGEPPAPTPAPTPEPSPAPGPGLKTRPSAPTPVPVPAPTQSQPLVEVGESTKVEITSTGYDDRPGAALGDVGCGTDGCLPELTRDGDQDSAESRWSCKEDIARNGDQCKIQFDFGEEQDVAAVEVAFYKWDVRSRTLKVRAIVELRCLALFRAKNVLSQESLDSYRNIYRALVTTHAEVLGGSRQRLESVFSRLILH